MISTLGELSLGALVPSLALRLSLDVARVLEEIAALQGDTQALAADITALTADLATLMAEQLDATSAVDALTRQLADLPGVALAGVQVALDEIKSGQALLGLQQALLTLPTTVRAGLEAAASLPQTKLSELTQGVVGVQSRIEQLRARIDSLATRIRALEAYRAGLQAEQATLGTGGIEAYVFVGPSSVFPGELETALQGRLPPGGVPLPGALVLVCQLETSWRALGNVLTVTP